MTMILIGLCMLVIGFLLVVYRRQVYNFTGQMEFVQGWFPGGTNSFILLFGVALVFLGLLFVTGLGGWLTQPISDTLIGSFGGNK